MVKMDKQNIKSFFFGIILFLIILIILLLLFSSTKTQNAILIVAIIVVTIYILFRAKIILQLKDYERAVVFRYGKLNRVGGPGWIFIIPFIERPNLVTLRVQIVDVPPQLVLTRDNIQLTIDALIYLSIKSDRQSVINSVVSVEDYKKAATLYVVAALRDVVGSFDLSDVVTNIEQINKKLLESLKEISQEWGVQVHTVEIQEIKIPDEILKAMHEQKAAVQKKLAVYELAESEKARILAVKSATESLSDKTVMFYYIKALEKMAEGQSTKIIFPMELTQLLEKISTNILKTDKITGKQLDKNIDENKLKKYLPLIKGYVDSEIKRRVKRK
jgi:regulator of protease activity HflC (stomatin/prohibitin superfamily)